MADLNMLMTDTPQAGIPRRHSLVFDNLRPRRNHYRAGRCYGSIRGSRAACEAPSHCIRPNRRPARRRRTGKILHEMRGGEMAALREVPFAQYYGSVDCHATVRCCWPVSMSNAPEMMRRWPNFGPRSNQLGLDRWARRSDGMDLSNIGAPRNRAWPIRVEGFLRRDISRRRAAG